MFAPAETRPAKIDAVNADRVLELSLFDHQTNGVDAPEEHAAQPERSRYERMRVRSRSEAGDES